MLMNRVINYLDKFLSGFSGKLVLLRNFFKEKDFAEF